MSAHNNSTNDQNKAADEAARTARTVTDEAARVAEQTARAGADIANRGTEAARNAVESGLNTATQSFQRISDQFTKVLGFNGPQAEELAHRSSDTGTGRWTRIEDSWVVEQRVGWCAMRRGGEPWRGLLII